MTPAWIANAVVTATALLAARVLFARRLRDAPAWRATVTPLASIIGSGFLVLAPILLREFGPHAVWAMAGLCVAAWMIGAALRWNIAAIDALGGEAALRGPARRLEIASSWMLALAYVVSVCYYLNLFGAFAVSLTPWDTPEAGRLVTSVVLVFIAVLGWLRGLHGLETAEALSVGLKLAIIAGLLAGLALHVANIDAPVETIAHAASGWHAFALACGLLITVQGFETSRYLGAAYPAALRVRTMRWAQALSSTIYIAYIGLVGLAFDAGAVPHRETAIIGMMAPVAPWLPALLVAAALAAQFSAAVADTNGCGGLAAEMSGGRLRARVAYAMLVGCALWLTWTSDIYAIISHASRAFAVYYALQCALAAVLARQAGRGALRSGGWATLAAAMTLAAVVGIPAE